MTEAVTRASARPELAYGRSAPTGAGRAAAARIGGAHPIGYLLLVLVNATLFIRPGEIIPALDNWPIYLWLIAACAACSLPALARQLNWAHLSQNPAVLCILLLLPAVFLSHASHRDLWSARYGTLEFSKTVLYFFLIVGLVNSLERVRGMLALTSVFITTTATLAILNYHEIFTLAGMTVLERGQGLDGETGELETFDQLQATGIFSDPNDFAVILVTAILGVLYLSMSAKNWIRRAGWITLLPILMYAFAMTKSRGGFLSLAAGIGAFLFAQYGWKKAAKIGVFLFPLLLVAFAGRQTNIDVGNTEDTAYGRVLLWREGLELFKQAPLFGIGQNLYGEEVGQVAHNSFVHVFAELGFFGGCLFLAAVLVPVFSIRKITFKGQPLATKALSSMIFAIIAAYAVGIFSLSRSYSNATYLVLGLACAYCAIGQSDHASWMRFDSRFVKRAAIAGVALLAFVVVFIRVVT